MESASAARRVVKAAQKVTHTPHAVRLQKRQALLQLFFVS